MKKITALICVLLFLTVLSGCGSSTETAGSSPTPAFTDSAVAVATPAAAPALVTEAPSAAATPVPAVPAAEVPAATSLPVSTAAPVVTPAPVTDYSSLYSSVISSYTAALRDNYSIDQCYSAGINYMVGYYTSGGRASSLGYCFTDVNSDGISELLIGEGNLIICMYTLVNGQPVQVIDGGERSSYYLEPDGTIVNFGSSSAFLSGYNFYHLEGGRLVFNNALLADYSVSETDPWFYTEDEDWDVSNDSHVSNEKANSWIQAYESNYVTLPYQSFL